MPATRPTSEDLAERLSTYADQHVRPGPGLTCDDRDSIGFYVRRAYALGDTLSREAAVEMLETWNKKRARCRCRADLPLANCSDCIRNGSAGMTPLNADALAEHLWLVDNPTRAAAAKIRRARAASRRRRSTLRGTRTSPAPAALI